MNKREIIGFFIFICFIFIIFDCSEKELTGRAFINAIIEKGDLSKLNIKIKKIHIKTASKEELRIIRNSIFAKYDYKHKSKDLKKHFSKFKWYKPKFKNVIKKLSHLDKKNIEFLLNQEKKLAKIDKNLNSSKLDSSFFVGTLEIDDGSAASSFYDLCSNGNYFYTDPYYPVIHRGTWSYKDGNIYVHEKSSCESDCLDKEPDFASGEICDNYKFMGCKSVKSKKKVLVKKSAYSGQTCHPFRVYPATLASSEIL
jgi:hypothetical protein